MIVTAQHLPECELSPLGDGRDRGEGNGALGTLCDTNDRSSLDASQGPRHSLIPAPRSQMGQLRLKEKTVLGQGHLLH